MPRPQTQGWDSARWFHSAQEVAPITPRECQGHEVQQLHVKIEKPLKRQATPPRIGVKVKNIRSAMNEEMPTTKDGAGALDSAPPRLPGTLQHQLIAPPRHKSEEEKPRAVLNDASTRPGPLLGKTVQEAGKAVAGARIP